MPLNMPSLGNTGDQYRPQTPCCDEKSKTGWGHKFTTVNIPLVTNRGYIQFVQNCRLGTYAWGKRL